MGNLQIEDYGVSQREVCSVLGDPRWKMRRVHPRRHSLWFALTSATSAHPLAQDQQKRTQLLSFTSGSKTRASEGFLEISFLDGSGQEDTTPLTHTCFDRLDLASFSPKQFFKKRSDSRCTGRRGRYLVHQVINPSLRFVVG